MSFFILFLLTITSYIYFWIKNRRNYWKDRGFDYVELELPFGSFKGVGIEKSLAIAFDEFYKKFKGKAKAVGLFTFLKPFLLIIDNDLLKHILIQNFDSFHDRYLYYNKEDDPISAHLLALQGQEWRDRRAKLTPTFTSGKMRMMCDIVDEISNKLVETLENSLKISSSQEMHEIVARYTTDVISNVSFGLDSNSLNDPQSEMRKIGRDIISMSPVEALKFHFTCAFPELSRKLHLIVNKPKVIEFFCTRFKKNVAEREKANLARKDFLQLLLDMKKSSTMSVDELTAESYIFFLGGFETSSTLLSYTLYALALNPDCQDRLRDEIRQANGTSDGEFSYDLINSLKYLEMVVNESMRLYPPAFNLLRRCNKDFKIPETNLIIPAGTDIGINVFSLHRDPEYFPEPEKFDPERFSPENSKSIPPCVFIPFGNGPRRCIGGRFALMQSKMGLAKLILNFEFSPCEKTSVPMKFSPTSLFLKSADDMWLSVKRIQ